jgi:hypothetical protein
VVLEADQGCGVQIGERRVDHDVSDEASLPGFGAHVDEADAWESLTFPRLVVVAEELVAAADGEYLRACLDCPL